MSNYTAGTITISPGSGNGTTSLSIVAAATTKRSAKTVELHAKGTGDYSSVESSNTLYITQTGIGTRVNMSGNNISSSGGAATLTGQCNLQTITLSDTTGELNNLLSYLTSASITIGSGAPIDITSAFTSAPHSYTPVGDPGEEAPYTLTLGFSNIPTTETQKVWHITVGSADVTLIQAGASPGPGPVVSSVMFTSSDSAYESDGNIVVPMSATGGTFSAATIAVTTSSDNPSWTIVEITP